MTSPAAYSYQGRQPDPEIWSEGVSGGQLTLTTGSEYSEKILYRYSLDSSPGVSLTGEIKLLSGISSEYSTKSYFASAENITLSGNKVEDVVYNSPRTTLNIQLNGNVTEYFISKETSDIFNFQSSGKCVEKTTYNYVPLSDEITVSGNAFCGHVINKPLTYQLVTLSSSGNENITYNTSIFDGEKLNIKLTGSAIEYFASNPPENTFDILIVESLIEKVSFDYNESSIVNIGSDNYETIGNFVTEFQDYGEVSSEVSQGNEDYNSIITNSTNNPFGGISVSGSAIVSKPADIKTYNALGEYRVTYNTPENTASLFSFGERIESVVYDYNINSVDFVDLSDDGSISSSITIAEDLGLITEIVAEFIDYEEIDITQTNNPFGSFNLNGSANTEWINKNFSAQGEYKVVYSPDNTNGTLFAFGEKIESNTYDYNLDSRITYVLEDSGSIISAATEVEDLGLIIDPISGIDSYGDLEVINDSIPFGSITINGSANTEWINKNFSASGEYKITYSPDNTSGVLFAFGEKIETISYHYNIDSIFLVSDTNYGQIINSVDGVDDSGLISEIASQSDNYGDLLGPSVVQDVYPFGQVTLSGQLTERNTESYTPTSYNVNLFGGYTGLKFVSQASETTSLFTISGSAGEQQNTYTEIGSGSLFAFGEKLESATYDYNEQSINSLISDTYGLITDVVSEIGNYGLITDQLDAEESYDGIEDTVSLIPFGSISLSGSASVVFGNYDFYGEAVVKATYSPNNLGGSLFAFGEKIESNTYDYNEQSIVFFVNDNLGTITATATEFDDNGLISEVPNALLDYGNDEGIIVGFGVTETLIPFGTISVSGSSDNIILGYSQDNTVLFTISGQLNPPNVDYTPALVGFGTVYINGTSDTSFIKFNESISTDIEIFETAIESRSYDYNESSIVTNVTPNYGSITSGLSETTSDYGTVASGGGETLDYGSISLNAEPLSPFGQITISGTTLVYPEVDYTPAYTGSGTIFVGGSATYSETDSFGVGRRRGGTINLTGRAIESETDSYVGIGTIVLDKEGVVVPGLIARTLSYNGTGSITLSSFVLESDVEVYVGAGTVSISGNALESYSAQTPENTSLFIITNTPLVHPFVDYTPHYGIEQNIGIGTTGIQIYGVVNDAANRISRGQGSIFVVNGFSPQESYPWLPDAGVGRSWSYTRSTYIGTGTAYLFNEVTRYYSPIYPRNALITDPSSGIGTIRINDDKQLTIYRATLPYNAKGSIFVSGTGFESFTETTFIGSGKLTLSGISSTREIAVYQDFVTSGTIVISQQSQQIIEKNTESYVGTGIITVSGSRLVERSANSYSGSGQILNLTGSSEAYSAQTPEDTVLINISGSAKESVVTQGVEETVLYQFSGAATDEKISKNYSGSGVITANSSASTTYAPSVFGLGGFKFARPISDDTYTTCDSTDVTSDYANSANISFVVNPIETEILFTISGSSNINKISIRTYSGIGQLSVYSQCTERFVSSYRNTQLFEIFGSANQSESEIFVGSGLVTFNSSGEYTLIRQPSEDTVLINIYGSSESKFESEFAYVGINLATFYGSANTFVFKRYSQVGSGNITLSGELNYPDIIFIPSPDGSGSINILGYGNESITYNSINYGTLFTLSSGFESTTKSTYIGIGTMYIDQISGNTINNPYQIPRVYVSII